MIFGSVPEAISAYVLALLGGAFGLQQYLKNWKSVKAESSIITLMHIEIERYSKQNKNLHDEVEKLQIQVRDLHSALNTLRLENENLRNDILKLTNLLHQVGSPIVQEYLDTSRQPIESENQYDNPS